MLYYTLIILSFIYTLFEHVDQKIKIKNHYMFENTPWCQLYNSILRGYNLS